MSAVIKHATATINYAKALCFLCMNLNIDRLFARLLDDAYICTSNAYVIFFRYKYKLFFHKPAVIARPHHDHVRYSVLCSCHITPCHGRREPSWMF